MRMKEEPSNGDVVGCTHCELSAGVGSGGSESGGDGTGGKHVGVGVLVVAADTDQQYKSNQAIAKVVEWSEDGRTLMTLP